MNPFKEKGYYLFNDFFSKSQLDEMYNIYNNMYVSNKLQLEVDGLFDFKVYAAKRSKYYDELNSYYDYATTLIEDLLDTKLIKTYHMGRVYTGSGGHMNEHIDRAPCEISLTFTIAHNKKNWPITLNIDDNDIVVETPPGSALLYAGDKIAHRRDANKFNSVQYQHYMHWVDFNSESGSLIYQFEQDQRGSSDLFFAPWDELKATNKVPVINV